MTEGERLAHVERIRAELDLVVPLDLPMFPNVNLFEEQENRGRRALRDGR